jgi:hypothetical protein
MMAVADECSRSRCSEQQHRTAIASRNRMIKSPTNNDPTLLRGEAAQLLLESVDDAITRQLMAIAYAEVRLRFEKRSFARGGL